MPDDVLIGYISEHLVGTKLTENKHFHSHLEELSIYDSSNIQNQAILYLNLFFYFNKLLKLISY